jgi:hypothetical protein
MQILIEIDANFDFSSFELINTATSGHVLNKLIKNDSACQPKRKLVALEPYTDNLALEPCIGTYLTLTPYTTPYTGCIGTLH